jgi:fatty acid CoA ligase FadD28
VYVASSTAGEPPKIVDFESDKLSADHAKRCANGGGTPLISYPLLQSPTVRIVDPETQTECSEGRTGEIWVHGDNVAMGYWRKPQETEHTFGAMLVAPSAGTPQGPRLRTGDLGFISDADLFIVGRIKDLLIVYGRNHSPDDIEATIQEITGGRVAAIAVPDEGMEQLVVIIEVKRRGDSDEDVMQKFVVVKREVTSAISNSHGLGVADLVLVHPVRFPSPPAARSVERLVSSSTSGISSPAWTHRHYRKRGGACGPVRCRAREHGRWMAARRRGP